MKLKATIISIISVLIVGLTAILLYCFWPAIKGTVDNSKYYTQEELQDSYDKGYEDGCKTETELIGQVKYYKDLVDEYYIQVNTLNDEITMLTNTNRDYATHVSTLESQKISLQEQVVNLTTIKSNNETTISGLNTQIAELQKEVANLENSGEDKDDLIAQKNTQITNLQSTVSQLQKTNELNVETITNLNNQIASLNTQITDMTLQIQNNSTNVTALNNKIAELEKSVAYYEQYIANLENGEQVVATFEFNGSVYNIQIVNKNSTVSVVNPTSTDYVIFNYWTVNGEQIDLSTYQITSNVKIVANVTLKYDVKFMVDETEYDSQIVIKNGYATIPANPTKTGYEFDGWTTNGVDIVNPNTTAITQNTTYVAKFTKLHTVTFMYEDAIYTTQTVRNNEYSSVVAIDSTIYKVFNGWKLNGVIVDITSQKIVADITFVADITYKYDVNFMVDDTNYSSQIVTHNGYATLPVNPTKDGYEFDGWTINGVDIVNPDTIAIIENTTYIAKFTQLYTVTFMLDNTIYETQYVNSGNVSVPVNPTKDGYVFYGWSLDNETLTDISNIEIVGDITFYSIFDNAEYGWFEVRYNDLLYYFVSCSTGEYLYRDLDFTELISLHSSGNYYYDNNYYSIFYEYVDNEYQFSISSKSSAGVLWVCEVTRIINFDYFNNKYYGSCGYLTTLSVSWDYPDTSSIFYSLDGGETYELLCVADCSNVYYYEYSKNLYAKTIIIKIVFDYDATDEYSVMPMASVFYSYYFRFDGTNISSGEPYSGLNAYSPEISLIENGGTILIGCGA